MCSCLIDPERIVSKKRRRSADPSAKSPGQSEGTGIGRFGRNKTNRFLRRRSGFDVLNRKDKRRGQTGRDFCPRGQVSLIMNGMNRKQKRLLLVLVLSSLLQFLFLHFGNLQYETNDDELFNLIAAGAYGFSGSARLIFINYIFCLFLKLIYVLFPSLNGYLILFLGLNCLSATLLCYILSEKLSLRASAAVVIGFHLLLRLNFFAVLQFTKNAFLYTVTGFVFLLSGMEKRNSKRILAGLVFTAVGFMVRWESAIFITPFFLVRLAFLTLGKQTGKSALRLSALIFAVLFGIKAVDALLYSPKPWADYLRYNNVRSELLDYGFAPVESQAEAYEKIGFSMNDLEVLRDWNFADDKVFTYEKMKALDAIQIEQNMTISRTISEANKAVQNCIVAHPVFPLIWITLLSLVFIRGNRREQLIGILYSAIILGLYGFLCIQGRIQWRVELGIWMTPIVLIVPFLTNRLPVMKAKTGYFLLCFGIALILISERDQLFPSPEEKPTEYGVSLIHSLAERTPDYYYLGDGVALSSVPIVPDIRDITREEYEGLFLSNYHILGGWEYPSPLVLKAEEKRGITNPLEDLLHEDVYYITRDNPIDHPEERILRFLQEHYDENASMTDHGYFKGVHIYKYHPSASPAEN